jgi:hypothetical protein
MTCWVRLLLIGLVIGSADATLALQSPQDQSQPGASGGMSPQTSQERAIDGENIGPRVRPKPGETCIVCNNPVAPDDSVYLVQGQRVPVHAGAEENEFFLRPRRYLMRLKPLGGALLGADSNQPGMANRAGDDRPGVSRMWIYSGLYVLLGLVFAALCAHRALHKGYSPGLVWTRARSECNRLHSPADPSQARGLRARWCAVGLGQDRGHPFTSALPPMRHV